MACLFFVIILIGCRLGRGQRIIFSPFLF